MLSHCIALSYSSKGRSVIYQPVGLLPLIVHEQMAKFRTIGTSLWDLKPYMLLHARVPGVSETTIRTAGQSSFYSEFAVLP